jgi:hypothetical protein
LLAGMGICSRSPVRSASSCGARRLLLARPPTTTVETPNTAQRAMQQTDPQPALKANTVTQHASNRHTHHIATIAISPRFPPATTTTTPLPVQQPATSADDHNCRSTLASQELGPFDAHCGHRHYSPHQLTARIDDSSGNLAHAASLQHWPAPRTPIRQTWLGAAVKLAFLAAVTERTTITSVMPQTYRQ